MSLIEKAYFSLEEVEERWQLPRRDLAYLAENGLLRLSIRLYGVRLESGQLEQGAEGRSMSVPFEQRWFDGLQDLCAADAYRLFRDGQVEVQRFAAPEGEYRRLMRPTQVITVRQADVVIRREERDRIEQRHDLPANGSRSGSELQYTLDYAEVRYQGLVFHFGQLQARVVRHLHQAALSGKPWCAGKAVLRTVGSSSTRLADVFKSQQEWRRLIDSDGRGNYRLRSPSSPSAFGAEPLPVQPVRA